MAAAPVNPYDFAGFEMPALNYNVGANQNAMRVGLSLPDPNPQTSGVNKFLNNPLEPNAFNLAPVPFYDSNEFTLANWDKGIFNDHKKMKMRQNPWSWAQRANQDQVKLRNYINEKFQRLYRGLLELPNSYTREQAKAMALHAVQGEIDVLRTILKDTYDVSQPSTGAQLAGPAMDLIDGGIGVNHQFRVGQQAIAP